MVNAPEIREQLARFLFGDATLERFEEWFVPETWDADKAGDAEAEDLTNEIDLAVSEYTSGHLSAEELRTRLADVAFPPFAENRLGDASPLPVAESYAVYATNAANAAV